MLVPEANYEGLLIISSKQQVQVCSDDSWGIQVSQWASRGVKNIIIKPCQWIILLMVVLLMAWFRLWNLYHIIGFLNLCWCLHTKKTIWWILYFYISDSHFIIMIRWVFLLIILIMLHFLFKKIINNLEVMKIGFIWEYFKEFHLINTLSSESLRNNSPIWLVIEAINCEKIKIKNQLFIVNF